MLTLEQVDRFFFTAQVILFLGIVGIFLGYYISSNITMDVSLSIELFVGFSFLLPLKTVQVKKQIEMILMLVHCFLQQRELDGKTKE